MQGKYFFGLLLFLLLYSCSSNQNTMGVKKDIINSYRENGDSVQYAKVVLKEGDYSIGKYVNSKKDSTWLYFNDNQLFSIKNWLNGKRFGEQYQIKDGIKLYTFYSTDSKQLYYYEIKNDKISEMNGSPIYLIENKNTVKKKEVYKNSLFLPPNNEYVKYHISSILLNSSNIFLQKLYDSDTDSITFKGRGYYRLDISIKEKQSGKYCIKYIVEILNEKKIIKTDTLSSYFTIK